MINELILRVEYQDTVYDLPVDNDIPIRLDMSTVEAGEIGSFFGVGSQTFTLPGTKTVNKFFNYGYEVSQDDVPAMYNTLPCSVIVNGETILIGALQLLSVVTSEDGYVSYNVQVYDKVLQFEQALSDKLIKNADWSAYQHTLTSQSVVDSWDNNLLSGSIYYPIADYGRSQDQVLYQQAPIMQLSSSDPSLTTGYIGDSNSPMTLAQVLPAVRAKDTLDVIFDQVGFTYTGSFTETEDFNNIYILNKPKEGLGIVTDGDTSADFSAGSPSNQTVGISTNYVISASSEISDPSNSYNNTTMTYIVPETGNYTFQGQVGFFNPVPITSSAVVNIGFYLVIDPGTGNPNDAIPVDTTSILMDQSKGSGPHYLNVAYTDTFAPGVKLRLQGYVEQYTGPPSINTTFIAAYTQFKAINTPVTYEGSTVDMAAQWQADTKSSDILKGLITQFNLILTPQVDNTSVIQIETFDTWMRSGEVKDWTSKFDTAKRIQIDHTVDEIEKELFLKNADDNDRFSKASLESDPNEQYGTLRLLAENNISQGTKTVESFFSPTILGGAINFIPDVSGSEAFEGNYTIDYNTRFVLPHIYKWNNKAQESYISKPRIGYKVSAALPTGESFYIGKTGDNIEVSGSYTTLSNVAALPVVSGSTNDLHFNSSFDLFTGAALNLNDGVSAFQGYWKTYLDSLYWEGAKKVTLDLYFNEYEYRDIKLNDKILIKNQAYRINKISGFNISPKDVVTVELLKLYPAYWQL